MGSMFMSTFMMFVPQHVEFVFLTICCIGFFGMHIPYQESRKKGEVWPPLGWLRKIKGAVSPGKKPARPVNRRLDQMESLRNAGLLTEQEYRRKRNDILQ